MPFAASKEGGLRALKNSSSGVKIAFSGGCIGTAEAVPSQSPRYADPRRRAGWAGTKSGAPLYDNGFCGPERDLPKTRIAIVNYLNTAPLVWGLTDGPLEGKYELSFAVPSECAEMLRRGAADVAILPAIEYQRIPGLVALPEMAIAARGPVRSILVISKRPIENVRRMALDAGSRSSAALVRLLAGQFWRIAPEFAEAAPDPSAMLAEADAALVIGDPALRISVKMDALAAKVPSGGVCCGGDPAEWPVPGHLSLFVYDVAHQWREFTGLPCVLALWAARREAATAELAADLLASKAYGLERIGEIAAAAAEQLALAPAALENYLRENIDFGLDAANRAGLEAFFRLAAEAGLVEGPRPLEIAPAAARAAEIL
jgi:chorismate dehydratase